MTDLNKLLELLRSGAQGVSNGIASNVSGNVNLLNSGLGLLGMPVSDRPVMGSQWMRDKGLTAEPQNRMAGLLGEGLGMAAPWVMAAKAPEIASGLLKGAENLAEPAKLNKQAGVFKFPQDDALALAQKNAAKPISEGGLGLHPNNTPAERAKAMGFEDEGLMHGTTNDFPAFSKSSRHSTYATDDPKIADIYATAVGRQKALREINASPNVIPLVSRGKRLETSDFRDGSGGWMGNNMSDQLGIPYERGLTKKLPQHGYDSAKVEMDDLGGRQIQYIFPEPNVLRSRFAAFDPARRNESDLLGRIDNRLLNALAGGGLLGVGAYNAWGDK